MVRFHHMALILAAVSLLSPWSCIREYGTVIPAQPTQKEGSALYEQKCSGCHGLGQVKVAHESMTIEELRELLKRMKAKPRSEITDVEIEEILRSFEMQRISPID